MEFREAKLVPLRVRSSRGLCTGDEYKSYPSRHGSIALLVPEIPKMSVLR